MKRIGMLLCMSMLICTLLSGCGKVEPEALHPANQSDETWAVYWYLCGSDLESNYGCATDDLEEMLAVELPEEIQIVIQTGGALHWYDYGIEHSKIGRYLYDSEGLCLVGQLPQANMGKTDTLEGFLAFCRDNYPADHTMLLFWDHGGGSVGGVAFDENYGYDSLTLSEIGDALRRVYIPSDDEPPFDVVGFDACLMATVDTADTLNGMAKYLVASEEMEPSGGWYYTGWLQELSKDTGMDGALLGRAICDAYVKGCELENTAGEITLSVTDLTELEPLMEAYGNIGNEALLAALKDPTFFAELGRAAMRSESYGGNTPDQGYANMVDLGHLIRNSAEILPENSLALLEALDSCIVYRVNGPYRSQASGLSCYYSYNSDLRDFLRYTQEGSSDAFKYLYGYALGGAISDAGMKYVEALGYQEDGLPEVPVLENTLPEDADLPVQINDEGHAVLNVGPELAEALRKVSFQLAYLDTSADRLFLLGSDNDLHADWENGVFTDHFRGVWGAIDNCMVHMSVVYEGADYNTYAVPVLLNGELCSLRVVYDYGKDSYYILGARKGLDESGMTDKNLRQLRPGDELSILHYSASVLEDGSYTAQPVYTLTVTENTAFEEAWLNDGMYLLMFELEDIHNRTAWSQVVLITIDGDYINAEAMPE